MTIRVCQEKFNHTLSKILLGIIYFIQIITPIMFILGLYYGFTTSEHHYPLIILLLIVMGFLGGLVSNLSEFGRENHWLISLNKKFHIISWDKDC